MLVFVISALIVNLGSAIRRKSLRALAPFILLAVVSLPFALLTNREFDSSPIFTVSKLWEITQYVDKNLLHFGESLGALGIFILPGFFLRKGRPLLATFLIIFSLMSSGLFFSQIPALLSTTPIRYLSPFGFLGLAVLGVDGLGTVSKLRPKLRLDLVFGSLILLMSAPAFAIQVTNRLVPDKNPLQLLNYIYNHVPAPLVRGLIYLGRQPGDPQKPVVLVDAHYRIEVLVPAFADKTVFSGHPLHTLNPDLKEKLRQNFFDNRLTPAQAANFLASHRIGYIITGTNGEPYFAVFPFIREIFHNSAMRIFKVK